MKFKTGNALALLLAAVIWGAAFVAQTTGGDAIGPFAFNGIRMLMGALVLVPVILVMDKVKPSGRKPVTKAQKKQLWLGGFLSGAALFVATNLQQVALTMGTGTGKAGFLTTIYILIVPIIGLFLKKKCGWNVWVGVVLALAGIYLLTNISSWQ
ncbi:MAG: DMT family transporter, partial [Parasporobacterium sp.]|nr:DMT family transporter [Parasporobacterium sp.]